MSYAPSSGFLVHGSRDPGAEPSKELLTVRHVGAPLCMTASSTPTSDTEASPTRSSSSRRSWQGSGFEFIFEVRSSLAQRQPWNIQRSHAAIANLHQCLQATFAGTPLPMLPGEPQNRMVHRLFQSEERRLKELAAHLEGYLNTLLASPPVRHCQVLEVFLEVPAPPEELTAEHVGEVAAEVVTSCCSACRAFCRRLLRPLREEMLAGALEDDTGGRRRGPRSLSSSLTENVQTDDSGPDDAGTLARQRLAAFAERQLERQRSDVECAAVAPRKPSVREIHVLVDGKLREWRWPGSSCRR